MKITEITEITVAPAESGPYSIVAGSDGALYVALENGAVARIATSGT